MGPAADKKFYMRLMVDKMRRLALLTENYLRPTAICGTNFTAAVNCTNLTTEILSEIMEIEIIETQM